MARKLEAEQLLSDGQCPAEIARHMGISVKSVIQYLRTRVGEGSLRLSDIYFSWSPEARAILQRAGQGQYPDDSLLISNDLCREELELFQSLRKARVFRGDMYEHVCRIELTIHALVHKVLSLAFGVDESGWWRKGVPSAIRVKCVSALAHFVLDISSIGVAVIVMGIKARHFTGDAPAITPVIEHTADIDKADQRYPAEHKA